MIRDYVRDYKWYRSIGWTRWQSLTLAFWDLPGLRDL